MIQVTKHCPGYHALSRLPSTSISSTSPTEDWQAARSAQQAVSLKLWGNLQVTKQVAKQHQVTEQCQVTNHYPGGRVIAEWGGVAPWGLLWESPRHANSLQPVNDKKGQTQTAKNGSSLRLQEQPPNLLIGISSVILTHQAGYCCRSGEKMAQHNQVHHHCWQLKWRHTRMAYAYALLHGMCTTARYKKHQLL